MIRLIRSPHTLAPLLTATALTIILAAGCLRYGGPDNIWQRVQMEVAARQPHPEFVPTPLPVATAQSEQSSAVQVMIGSTASPTSISTQPTPIHQLELPSIELTGFSHMWQTWNNCGPATLAMNLSYYGSRLDQADIGEVLRRHPDDKNVGPTELAAFAREQGYQARVRVNGNDELARLFLSNGIPILIETWLEPEPNDGMGHYRMLTGYDDLSEQWLAYDSYVSHDLIAPDGPYRGIRLAYRETGRLWEVFNGTYVLIYTEQQAPIVESILGEEMDESVMWQRSLVQAQQNTVARPNDPFAWFNLGTSFVALGDYAQAAAAYDRARQIGLPWRMLWYQFGPFVAYYEIGRYQEVIALTDATIATTQSVEELYYWKGRGLAALGDVNGARRAWQRALDLNPDYSETLQALAAINS